MAINSNTYGWHTVIVLFLRTVEGFVYPMRLDAEARAEADRTIGSQARVQRPGLVGLLMPTGNGRSKFARMSPVTAAEVSALRKAADAGKLGKAEQATLSKGFIVPADSLGRNVRKADWQPDHSTGESLRLWIKQRVAPTGLAHGEDVSIVPVPVTLIPKADRP